MLLAERISPTATDSGTAKILAVAANGANLQLFVDQAGILDVKPAEDGHAQYYQYGKSGQQRTAHGAEDEMRQTGVLGIRSLRSRLKSLR